MFLLIGAHRDRAEASELPGTPGESSGGVAICGLLWVDASAFGVRCDGVRDITKGLQSAVDFAARTGVGSVRIAGSRSPCIVSETIVVPSNVRVEGVAGNGDGLLSEIRSIAPKGDVFHLAGRSAGLARLKITADARRRGGSGHGVRVDRSGKTPRYGGISRVSLDDLWIKDQPNNCVHIVRSELGYFRFITADSCGWHGIYMDDGIMDSYPRARGDQVFNNTFVNSRAILNGRAGIVQRKKLGGVRHNTFINCQALGNDNEDRDGYQWILTGSTNILLNPDLEDQQWRESENKSRPTVGLHVSGANHYILGGHWSSLTRAIDCEYSNGLHVEGLMIYKGHAEHPQDPAIQISKTCTGSVIIIDGTRWGEHAATRITNDLAADGLRVIAGVLEEREPTVVGDAPTPRARITSGAIVVNGGHSVLAVEGEASRQIDRIEGGALGQRLVLWGTQGQAIRLSDGAESSNLLLRGPVALASNRDLIELIFNGDQWVELVRRTDSSD